MDETSAVVSHLELRVYLAGLAGHTPCRHKRGPTKKYVSIHLQVVHTGRQLHGLAPSIALYIVSSSAPSPQKTSRLNQLSVTSVSADSCYHLSTYIFLMEKLYNSHTSLKQLWACRSGSRGFYKVFIY